MGFKEDIMWFLSDLATKNLSEVPFSVHGLIFIEIVRGPLTGCVHYFTTISAFFIEIIWLFWRKLSEKPNKGIEILVGPVVFELLIKICKTVCLSIIQELLAYPGVTLHMTGYPPTCTKSIEKGSVLDIQRCQRLLQKGYTFHCLSHFRGARMSMF